MNRRNIFFRYLLGIVFSFGFTPLNWYSTPLFNTVKKSWQEKSIFSLLPSSDTVITAMIVGGLTILSRYLLTTSVS